MQSTHDIAMHACVMDKPSDFKISKKNLQNNANAYILRELFDMIIYTSALEHRNYICGHPQTPKLYYQHDIAKTSRATQKHYAMSEIVVVCL